MVTERAGTSAPLLLARFSMVQTVLIDRSPDRLAKVFPDLGKDHLPRAGSI